MQALSRHASTIALLAALLFGFFALMSYQVNRAETIGAVEGTLQTIVSPAHRAVAAVWLGASSVWQRYVGLVGAASQTTAMRQRIAVLERENAALEEAARENSRLRRLLRLRARIELPSIAAEAIGRDIAEGYERLTLNRGSRDGVEDDSAVLAPDGSLVGRVVRASPWTSTVQLLTDALSSVGVENARSGAVGVVHGTGGPTLEVAYVPILEEVAAGDVFVTSGDDGIYPPGIRVGRVETARPGSPVPGSPRVPLSRDETALFWDIALVPLVDVRQVDHLLIVEPNRHVE